jgi:signal transduction histidine kinase
MVDPFARAAVFTVLALTLLIYLLATPALAFRWLRQPFLGAFVEQTLVFNNVGATGAQPWPAFAAGVQPGDELLAIDGTRVDSSGAISRVLDQKAAGQSVTLSVARNVNTTVDLSVPLTSFPAQSFITLFVVPYFVGLVYIIIGLLIYWLRRNEAAGRAFALFCATAAVGLGGLFDLYTTHWFTWGWTLAVPTAGAALMTLGMVFPQEVAAVQRRPAMRLLPYIPALALAAYALYTLYLGADPREYVGAWRYQYAFLGAGIILFLVMTGYRRFTSPSPIAREQMQVILLGAVAAFALLLAWAIQPLFVRNPPPLNAALDLPLLAIFPAAVAYAILRYRLLDTDFVTSQMLIYTAMAVLTLAGYGLILTGATVIFGAAVQASNPLVIGLVIFLLVVGFNPLRDRLQGLVNDTFFRGQRAYTERLATFGRALTRAMGLGDIAAALAEQLEGALRPAHVYLFLRDPVNEDFAASGAPFVPAEPGARQTPANSSPRLAHTDLRFADNGALATALARERAAIYLTSDSALPAHLLPDRARLAVLGAAIYAPLPGQSGLAGWLAVGPKLSGQPFTRDDVRFVESLADQSALAIERATVISDLERRVRELNVLSQMSQAVNFTLNYDDLLELIYAQASKVVDTRQFTIALKDTRGPSLLYAFYVENDERDNAQENKPWPVGRGLESEVVRTGQPIRTDDYLAECRRRDVMPRARPAGRQAWLGVPLNTGAETIGVMAVSAAFSAGDPADSFSDDQLKILWAIADQAASAMAKAQLLQKAEERARQLSTLNEVSTTMAASLDLDPMLVRIVNSSMSILGCEAGSLFLIDDDTGEYVFRVAAGPVGQNLVGMRIAPGKGFVGEAIESASVVIVNDVQNDPRWFRGSDETTGFVTRALMVVPLRRGERTVGALEVINKRDGAPFNDEDRNLLAAFAGQAAVAIENARLFAQTDQALSERVAELSVMQRIDRELNAALDVQRVMDITLDWAMKNTRAYAGSVGMVVEGGIRIIATSGYGDTVEKLRDQPLPIDRGIMGRVVRTGQLSRVRDVRADPDYRGILPATRSQLTIPIVREGAAIGLINLESPEPDAFSDEQVAFVTRLLDHASVAIANARLYAEVIAANIAKSDFVSVAAHELRTPMTSIKMSSELLLAGAVGALNDTQRQFLTTIKNNLDRMTTIVSDLNDITRIETGRLRLELRPWPFRAVVDEVLRNSRGLFESKQQVLTLDMPDDLPPVLADSNRAAQALTNLLSNAYKYTPEKGEITLSVRAEPAGQAGGWLHIAVHDTGIGISPEDQSKLFQKFFRSEDRTAREMAPGTGLGLNIVKNLVELQGGRIWFESEFRRGSTFHFTLPLATGAEARIVAPAAN